MRQLMTGIVLVVALGSWSQAGTTKIRSGQINFGEGIDEDLKVSGDLLLDGTGFAEVVSVTGEVTATGRLTAGDASHSLTITVPAVSFNAWIGSPTDAQWLFDGGNYTAYPKETGSLKTGIVFLWIAPGTQLYQVMVHGVFVDDAAQHELRARVYKLNVSNPTNPIPLTSEAVQEGGVAGPFSVTLTPDYVVEEGYACLVKVQLKNQTVGKTLLFGIRAVLHETQY
jgi:hypothetical protein